MHCESIIGALNEQEHGCAFGFGIELLLCSVEVAVYGPVGRNRYKISKLISHSSALERSAVCIAAMI
jgi:hypothetical protein